MKNKIKKLMNRALRKEEGFTLVEIIVVIVIMAILAAIAIPSVLGYINDANDAAYIAEARSVYLACQVEEAKYNAVAGNLSSTASTYVHVDKDTNGTDGMYDEVVARVGFDGITVTDVQFTAGNASATPATKDTYVLTFTSSDGTSGIVATVVEGEDITIS